MKCRKCKTEMAEGIAMAPTFIRGLPDYPGQTDFRGQTVHMGGSGRIADVHKCPECGHSVERVRARHDISEET